MARSLFTGRFAADGPPADGSLTEPFHDSDSAPAVANGPPALSGSSSAILPGSSELSASSDPDRQFFRSVARIGIQVAEALEYANRQGILHRDVKPSNLLLDNHGNVWVADFGLAKTAEADDLTHTGDILGTIRYMAPERFSGLCDARSDVYSLGLTLYELVALRPAYEASDRHRLMERVLHEEPERLKKLASGVPRDLETIVSKSIGRDPAMRYASAAALAEDLRRFVEDRPIRARRVSSAEQFAGWCRRNKVLASSIGVAAAALVTIAAMALIHANRQAKANQRITRLASDLEERSRSLESSLTESNRRLAILNLERGQAAFEKGQIGVGMLWTVESLRMAAAAGDEAGKHVALANLSAWRRQFSEPKRVIHHGTIVSSAAFSPDGKTVLTAGGDNAARLWDVATGKPIGEPLAHPDWVRSTAFSPDGKTILTACSMQNMAWLWDAATGRSLRQTPAHLRMVSSLAFSPDGKTILTGSRDGTARLWDAEAGEPVGRVLEYESQMATVAFGPDGKTLVAAHNDGRVWIRDIASGRRLGQPVEQGSQIYAVALSPNGKMILTGSSDKTARLWDAETGRLIGQPMVHSDDVWSVAFSPESKTVITCGSEKTARLWNAATGEPIGQPIVHSHRLITAKFSPDGMTILTGGWDGMARLWDAVSGRLIGRPMAHSDNLTSVAFSPDGKTILTGSMDMTARLWDAASGEPVGPPMRHSDRVASVAFSPDGKTAVTGSYDKTARLWDAASGRPIGPPMQHSGRVRELAFTSDGRFLLTNDLTTVRGWDTPAPLPDDLPRLAAWVEVTTGLELHERGSIRVLDRDAWLERRRRLEPLGGPPPPNPAPRLDPILFGGEPAARGDAWKERGEWDRAEADYSEAVRARPLNVEVRQALVRLYTQRGDLGRAAVILAEGVRLKPDDLVQRGHLGVALLASGDRAGWRSAIAAQLDRFGGTRTARTANNVAWACVLEPEATADPAVPVRLVEAALRDGSESSRDMYLNTLGAALYRAGRYAGAIRRLEEAIERRGGASIPEDWPFLAMAHHRLGQRAEATRWLDRLRHRKPSTEPAEFWHELEIQLLRSEAEAVILYDPVFPADPLAKRP